MRIAIPPRSLGQRHPQITAWARRELRRRRVGHDALSIYFADATLASAFVAWWCVRAKVESAGGVFQLRDDEREARVGGGPRKTP
jgi:hypothetical protein